MSEPGLDAEVFTARVRAAYGPDGRLPLTPTSVVIKELTSAIRDKAGARMT